jgi:hypothetical protein
VLDRHEREGAHTEALNLVSSNIGRVSRIVTTEKKQK